MHVERHRSKSWNWRWRESEIPNPIPRAVANEMFLVSRVASAPGQNGKLKVQG